MGIPKTFCDIVGILPGGIMIGVRLKRSVSSAFTAEQARRLFFSEIAMMKFSCPDRPCRLEIWIASTGGRWQFFEIAGNDVREVHYAGRP
jgi:hypothetical protein